MLFATQFCEKKSPHKAYGVLADSDWNLVALKQNFFSKKAMRMPASQEHKYSTAHFVRKDAVFTEINREVKD